MSTLRPSEWEQLCGCFADAECATGADGTTLITLPSVRLPEGWSAPATTVRFVVPVGYPAAQPDCFWAAHNLRLANGSIPANSGVQAVPVVQTNGLWFSWHLAAWRPSHDNVTTYARFILRRFDDAR